MEALQKMLLFLELIWAHLCILIIKNDISILGERPRQGSDDTTLAADVKYPFNLTQSKRRFVLSLHYNGSRNFLFVNAIKIHQFKAKESEAKPYPLCFGNISKDFTINNMRKRKMKQD